MYTQMKTADFSMQTMIHIHVTEFPCMQIKATSSLYTSQTIADYFSHLLCLKKNIIQNAEEDHPIHSHSVIRALFVG